jgi:hypothetical protein
LEENIKIDLIEIVFEDAGCIRLAQVREQWWVLASWAVDLRFP